jgi:ornithine cyclodeaminase
MSTQEPMETADRDGLLVLSAADVTQVFDMDTAIESQRVAFRELGLGHAQLPARLLLSGPEGSSSFCYAARVSDETGAVCKFGSAAPANAERGLPTIAAVVTALDPQTGRPVALMDGTTVTTIRTSAASAVAAEALARPESSVLAVLGSGVQAEAHVEALARVLPLSDVRVWGRTAAKAEQLVARLAERFDFDVSVARDPQVAVAGADVVVAATTSATPVLEVEWLAPGATVISVGSFAADRSEVPVELLRRAAAVVVDDVETSLEHAGPVVAAVHENVLGAGDLVSLGSVVAGLSSGRSRPEDIVFYNSVGIGVQDAAAAWAVITAARERGLGQQISL